MHHICNTWSCGANPLLRLHEFLSCVILNSNTLVSCSKSRYPRKQSSNITPGKQAAHDSANFYVTKHSIHIAQSIRKLFMCHALTASVTSTAPCRTMTQMYAQDGKSHVVLKYFFSFPHHSYIPRAYLNQRKWVSL